MAPRKSQGNDRADANGSRSPAEPVSRGGGDALLGAHDLPGDSGGDGVEGPQVDIDLSAESVGEASQERTPTEVLISLLGDSSLVEINQALAQAIQSGEPNLTQILTGMAEAFHDSLAFVAEPLIRALAQMEVLEQPYEVTLRNILLGLEHIRLRSLYDVMGA